MDINEARAKVTEFESEVKRAKTSLNEYERMLFRCAALTRRMFGSEDIGQAISKGLRLISILRMIRTSLLLLEAASGPVGWITALAGLTMGVMMGGDMMMELDSG